jgi:protein TonB
MKRVAVPTYTAFDRPTRTLPRIAIVIALHALALFALVSGDRITRMKTPQTVLLLATVPPETVEPPPPSPPPPPRSLPLDSTPLPPPPEVSVPQLRDIEVAPRTEVAATIVDNAMPVEAAGGKLDGTGTAGAGGVGEATGSGRASVRVRAVLDPANCERPRLPWRAEQRKLTGEVILAMLIDVDGKVTDARIARSSGEPILDQTALAGARKCHFVAATVDKLPVRSWELFRFWWSND